MRRVLITGASGFVGSALCVKMSERGYTVRRAVRRAEGHSQSVPLSNETGLVVPIGDIGPDTDWTVALTRVDCVVHLAARVHVMKEVVHDPLAEFRRMNTAGTEHLARCAVKAGVKRLVFMSSIKVNGEATTDTPFAETDPPRPRDPYGISKWEAEQALARVAADTGLEIVILRSPLIYGPEVKGNFLSLVKAIVRGVPLPLAGIRNRRSLLYIGNAVDALVLAATHPSAAGRTFLLSDGQDVSTPDLIQQLAKLLCVRARLVRCPPFLLQLAGGMLGKAESVSRLTSSLQVDSSTIRNTLGWRPPWSLEQGLQATAEWYRKEP